MHGKSSPGYAPSSPSRSPLYAEVADTADEPQEEEKTEETAAAGDDKDGKPVMDKADADEPGTKEPPAKRQATDAAKDEACKEDGDTGTKADSGKGAGEADAQAPLEKKADIPDNVIEEGRIYFFYRPKVGSPPCCLLQLEI